MEINIDSFQSLLKNAHILDRYELKRIGIFGSFARGQKANDIDVLVEGNINYKKALALKSELEKVTQKKIDLVLEKYANPIILYRARKEMIYVKKHQK